MIIEESTAQEMKASESVFNASTLALAEYLRTKKPDLAEVAKYLVVHTFKDCGASALFIGVVRPNGGIHYPAGYGYKPENFFNIPERSLDNETPAATMLRTGEIYAWGAFDEYPFTDLRNAKNLFPNGFASSFTFPLIGFGGVVMMCQKELLLNDDLRSFFHHVGLILGLYCSVTSIAEVLTEKMPLDQPALLLTLTHRQWAILEEIRNGSTNIAIAHKLGYSESTIRHETMRIYKKLRVRGRVDLQELKF